MMTLSPDIFYLLLAGIFIIAMLYSSVGHAGASGYIAIMSMLSIAPAVIKPSALALNLLVASIATWQFIRAGHFSWRLFWPFAVFAVPMAYLGGYLNLPASTFKLLLGIVLLYSAFKFIMPSKEQTTIIPPKLVQSLVAGAAIGLIAGLTGTGGGIFITPLILLMGWASAKQAAAVSAPFILLNSASGLLGNIASSQSIPHEIGLMLICAGVGGAIGSYLGSQKFDAKMIKRFLALVLLIAGLKLMLS
jgi:uncharacterized protein